MRLLSWNCTNAKNPIKNKNVYSLNFRYKLVVNEGRKNERTI